MDVIIDITKQHNLLVVEDAAQEIDLFYKGKPLGGIGHFGCFSFHEIKNIQCSEGGILVINCNISTHRLHFLIEAKCQQIVYT